MYRTGGVLIKVENLDTEERWCEETQERCCVKREAETEIMLPETKKCLELSEVRGVKKRSLSYKFQKEHNPAKGCLGLS